MLSIGDKIAKFIHPTPQVFDPEDEINPETAAKISSDIEQDDDIERSDLRRRTAPLLEDRDPTYAGKKVTRRSLGQVFCKGDTQSKADHRSSISSNEFPTSSSDEEDEESMDDLSDSDIKKFKTLVHSQSDERVSSEDEQSVEEEQSVEDVQSGEDEASSEEEDDKIRDDMTQQFSNFDVTSEIEKGQAVKNQKEIWNRLLEMRIKLQKLLIITNKLPQGDVWEEFKDEGGKDMTANFKKGCQSVKNLLNHFLKFHNGLLNKNLEITQANAVQSSNKSQTDEEICSDTDEEVKESEVSSLPEKIGTKRKLTGKDYNEVLAKQLKTLLPYRNTVIQKFDEKTKLSTGRITQKSFNAFDNSALKQIEQILQDKTRLIRRTQLKRSVYQVLGKSESSDTKHNETSEIEKSKQDMLLKDYDPEIFDDDDFYRQILKDIIDNNSFGLDPAIIRKQMEIQKIRNKMKRKVDTKASKGRKLRYDIHPKVVNFMAPVQTCQLTDEERTSFLKCLFGGRNKS